MYICGGCVWKEYGEENGIIFWDEKREYERNSRHMNEEKKNWLQDYLQKHNIVTAAVDLEEVSGGIVNNIYRAWDREKIYIIKEYSKTPKFDPSFVLPEGRYQIEKAAYLLLDNIFIEDKPFPELFLADDDKELLVLQDVGSANRFDKKIHTVEPELFRHIGEILAKIANETYGKKELAATFNNTEFQELKNDIRYYRYIQNENLFPLRDRLMKRAAEHRVVFLHDDVRFNNMFLKGDSFVFIDFEGAYYGDLSLDIAHLLSELFLYHFVSGEQKFRRMIMSLWESYLNTLKTDEDLKELECIVTKHIGFGLLDRAQGVIKDDYPFVRNRARIMQIGEKAILDERCRKITDVLAL